MPKTENSDLAWHGRQTKIFSLPVNVNPLMTITFFSGIFI
jgi:hypothetical protein